MMFHNNDYLLSFSVPINTSILLNEYNSVKDNAVDYSDHRPRASFNNWKMVKHDFPYAKELIKFFRLEKFDVRPRTKLIIEDVLSNT